MASRPTWTPGNPINLAFEPIVVNADGLPMDLCLPESCLSTAFLPQTSDLGDGWSRDSIFRIADAGNPDCLLGILELCEVDPTFDPFRTDYRSDSRTGEIEFVPDLSELLRILALADLVGGAESSDEMARESLRRLGVDLDNLFLPGTIGRGAPWGPEISDQAFAYEARVPGPAPLALVTVALAAMALRALSRRRRPSPARRPD